MILMLLWAVHDSIGQVLPVGTVGLEDWYRRQQLMGKLDSSVSFSIRPLSNQVLKRQNIYNPDSLQDTDRSIRTTPNGKGIVQLMPVSWQQQATSSFPYSRNDGGMIPNVGYQTMLSAGVYLQYGFVSLQLNPEVVMAQNAEYQGYNGLVRASWRQWYTAIGNRMDKPERFGEGWYTRLLPGQSSLRFNFHPISVGVSTENLWWGPAKHNSLLMSNTAPGFAHITVNTTRPIRTPVGSFETQLIGGRLEGSGFPPTPQGNPDHYDEFYRPKPDDWRYLSGMVLTYQPKWLPGLSLGFSRAFTVYNSVMGNKLGDYIPFFQSALKTNYENPDSSGIDNTIPGVEGRDQIASVFARWVIPKENAEIYFEYGRNDHPWDMRDLIVQAEHSRSYIVGFRKLVPIQWFAPDDWLQFHLEVIQSEGPRDVPIRPGGPWYGHSQVRHGYTHLGQLIGAGIDPGSNMQTLSFSWIRNFKQLGIELERYVHNNDFFYRHNGDIRRNWVDFSMTLFGEWDYRNFILNSKMHFTNAYNYQYEMEERGYERTDFWNFRKQDKGNFQFQVGIMYRF